MKHFIKKLSLLIIGIILSLVILELSLRFAGFAMSSYQQYKNNKALKNKSQYTIMCLGESTTFGQYPVQLQELLNNKYPNKFSVIDCGVPATNLETIYSLTENNINNYKPDIAICILGINNGFIAYNHETKSINRNSNLKIYKLITLIYSHLKNLFEEKYVFANETAQENDINLAIIKFKERDLETAEKIFSNILKTDNNNADVYFYLIDMYYYNLNNKEKAYNLALDAINKNFQKNRTYFYMTAIKYCIAINDTNEIKSLINRLIYKEDYQVLNSDIYRLMENFLTKEEKELLIKRFSEQNDFRFLAINAIEQKDYKKAEEYFNIQEEIRLNSPNLETYKLYKLIIKKLIDNNIKVICMQYPVRSILPLQEQLKNEPYYDRITFISNEKLFKDALMNNKFSDLFVDQFAGDFGHCTDLGNEMIAENIVNTLENMLNLKQN